MKKLRVDFRASSSLPGAMKKGAYENDDLAARLIVHAGCLSERFATLAATANVDVLRGELGIQALELARSIELMAEAAFDLASNTKF